MPNNPSEQETVEHQALRRTDAPAPAAPRKTSVLGDYRLVAKLGEGAFGAVYRARHVRDGGEAALKVLSKQVADRPDFVARFLREARLMARLDHVNVLRHLAAGTSHGYHYLAMEYAGGGSLQTWLERLGRLELPDAACVVTAAARGLGYAHGHQLVHRDVKPDNLLFSAEGVLKVADLGLARPTAEDGLDLTGTGASLGTPLYAAPEQTRDAKRADGRGDLYALGCVFYRLLTGRLPFEAANMIELMIAKDRGEFVPPRKLRRGLPALVDRVVVRMLARRAEDRYPDCEALLDELGRLGTPPETPGFFRKPPA
jgi:serine/threonine-protein kinase